MADDIPGPAPPLAVGWRQERSTGGQGGGRHTAQEHARASDAYERSSPSPLAVDDALSVQGVPQSDLTPAVRRALGRLMGEVDRLRHEVESTRDEAWSQVAPRHNPEVLPLLDRQAMERQFTLSMEAAADPEAALPAVVFLYAGNYEQIRQQIGLAAAEAMFRAMAGAVARAREDGEVAGYLGGASAVLLVPFRGDVDDLWARARALAREAGLPAAWRSESLRVALMIGVHVPRRGEWAEDAFWQAERAARLIV